MNIKISRFVKVLIASTISFILFGCFSLPTIFTKTDSLSNAVFSKIEIGSLQYGLNTFAVDYSSMYLQPLGGGEQASFIKLSLNVETNKDITNQDFDFSKIYLIDNSDKIIKPVIVRYYEGKVLGSSFNFNLGYFRPWEKYSLDGPKNYTLLLGYLANRDIRIKTIVIDKNEVDIQNIATKKSPLDYSKYN